MKFFSEASVWSSPLDLYSFLLWSHLALCGDVVALQPSFLSLLMSAGLLMFILFLTFLLRFPVPCVFSSYCTGWKNSLPTVLQAAAEEGLAPPVGHRYTNMLIISINVRTLVWHSLCVHQVPMRGPRCTLLQGTGTRCFFTTAVFLSHPWPPRVSTPSMGTSIPNSLWG